LLAACLGLAGCFPAVKETKKEDRQGPKRPNVVLVLADDLAASDLNPNTLKHMPHVRALMEEGTTFDNSFVTNSLCCPSRATILRGQYVHNHGSLHNEPPLGGAERFIRSGADASTMATWTEERGYRTAFFGKYMNGYAGTYVPPGWDEWHAVSGNFLSDDLNENGQILSYDADRYHLDDVLA
jgi:N-acetylglucosamine-6-sulfatase